MHDNTSVCPLCLSLSVSSAVMKMKRTSGGRHAPACCNTWWRQADGGEQTMGDNTSKTVFLMVTDENGSNKPPFGHYDPATMRTTSGKPSRFSLQSVDLWRQKRSTWLYRLVRNSSVI